MPNMIANIEALLKVTENMTPSERLSFYGGLLGCLAVTVSDEDWNEAIKIVSTPPGTVILQKGRAHERMLDGGA